MRRSLLRVAGKWALSLTLALVLGAIPTAEMSASAAPVDARLVPGDWAGFGRCFVLSGDARYVYLQQRRGSSWKFVDRYRVYPSDCDTPVIIGGTWYEAYEADAAVGMYLTTPGRHTLRVLECTWDEPCGNWSAPISDSIDERTFTVEKLVEGFTRRSPSIAKSFLKQVAPDTPLNCVDVRIATSSSKWLIADFGVSGHGCRPADVVALYFLDGGKWRLSTGGTSSWPCDSLPGSPPDSVVAELRGLRRCD